MNPPPAHGEWPVTNAEYHADRTHLSSSCIRTFIESVEDFNEKYNLGGLEDDEKRKKDLDIGTALHMLLLEGEKGFKKNQIPWEPGNGNDLKVKAKRKEALAEQRRTGGYILTVPEETLVRQMADAVSKNPFAKALVDLPGLTEMSYTFEFEHLPCKVRFDRLIRVGEGGEGEEWKPNAFLDIKTCRDASPEQFAKDFLNHGYHIQAFFYREGFKAVFGEYPQAIYYIAFNKEAVYKAPIVYTPHDDFLEIARWKVLAACEQIETRRFISDWGSELADGPQVLKPPYWAMKAMEREIEDG